jgi:hypothetical protein
MKPEIEEKRMKRITLIALAAILIVTLGAGAAFAAAYNVTANFGIRVTEQGASERVGAITLAGATDADLFTVLPLPEQAIIGELLGDATISRTFGAAYLYGGVLVDEWTPTVADRTGDYDTTLGADYLVVAIAGQDFFSINILVDSAAGETIRLGHDEPSALCFNLQGTQYTASDPNRQLVLVSYADNLFNTYSGDIYVATVKPRTVTVAICDKTIPAHVISAEGTFQGPDCGIGDGYDCIFKFTDNASGTLIGDYRFVIGKTTGAKLGVGFDSIVIEKQNGLLWDNIPVTLVARTNRLGVTSALLTAAETSRITVDATLTGPGTYRVSAYYEYDTCVPITAGMWTVDIAVNLIPCGASFTANNFDIIEFFDPAGLPTSMVFPYAAASVNGEWFNGLVFTNPLSSAVTISVRIVEADGDVYLGEVTVPGNQMVVGSVAGVVTPVAASGVTDAEFGDESFAIYASSDSGAFYGFLFIGNGTMAQGYLPIDTSFYRFMSEE